MCVCVVSWCIGSSRSVKEVGKFDIRRKSNAGSGYLYVNMKQYTYRDTEQR